MLDNKDKRQKDNKHKQGHHQEQHHEWDKKSHHPDTDMDYDEFAKELSPDDFE